MFDAGSWIESLFAPEVWPSRLAYGVLLLAGVMIDVVLCIRVVRGKRLQAPPAARIGDRPIPARPAALIALILLNLQVVVALAGSLAPETSPVLWLIVNSVCFHGVGLALVAFALWSRGVGGREAFGWDRRRWWSGAAAGATAYLAALPAFFLAGVAWQMWLRRIGYPIAPQPVALFFAESDSPWARAYVVLLAVAVAPVAEEVLFRGIGLPVLARRVGLPAAALLTSMAFALVHFHVPSFLPLLVMASGFAAAYALSGSIVAPIVMHALFNAANLSMMASG